jgi:predicted RNA-binding Zn ribbon-like protein
MVSDRRFAYAGQVEERELRQIGERIEPGGRPKAPGRLELLQRFVNTHNHDFPDDWDRIGTAAKAGAWLREKRLVAPGDHVSGADAARLRELREALRALALANHSAAAPEMIGANAAGAPLTVALGKDGRTALSAAAETIRANAAAVSLRVALGDDGRTALVAAAGGVDGAVATLLGILHEAQLSGEWARMKGCRQCGYAFFDRSKNRSAAWCAMSICGNRTKNRTYYRRRRTATG